VTTPQPLKRQLGLAAVTALVVGDMVGSGVFFTPGELAALARSSWQVYFVWGLCGVITLCGALTLAELCSLLPRAGASFHIIREGFGPFWGFLKVWMELWVSGPGSVAGVAIVFGEYAHRAMEEGATLAPAAWGTAAILFFAAINILGVAWGGRTQIVLTTVKVAGIMALIAGGLLLAAPAASSGVVVEVPSDGLLGFFRFAGLGVAAVLFTYDGWVDVSHVAGEVRRPERNFPLGLGLGVASLTAIYLVVNLAYLRVVPLAAMREAPTTVATTVASAAFGPSGGRLVNALVLVSIFGALGGLVMTIPRLYYTLAATHREQARGPLRLLFGGLSRISHRTSAPVGAILFTAASAILALHFFGSFSRLVNFFVVPLQLANILMVLSIFKLRRQRGPAPGYRTPGYPWTPIVYAVVLAGFLVSALVFRPVETLIGLALTATGAPIYRWLERGPA